MNVIANDARTLRKVLGRPIKFMKEYRLPGGSDAGKLWYEIWQKSRPLGKHTIGTTALISLQ